MILLGSFQVSCKVFLFLSLELVNEFTEFVSSTFGIFIGFHQGLFTIVNNTMHHIDSSLMHYILTTTRFPNPNFEEILILNTTIIAHKINKLPLQILEGLHIKKIELIKLILKIATVFLNAFCPFF